MAKPNRARGEVPYCRYEPSRRVSVLAVRPEVLPLVTGYQPDLQWGTLIELEGTQDELISAGAASFEMFSEFGKSGVKSRPDEFGCRCTIKRLKQGRFSLERSLTENPEYGDPADKPDRWGKLLRESEAAIRDFVARALAVAKASRP